MSETTNPSANELKIDPLLKQCHDFWFGLFQKAMDNSSFVHSDYVLTADHLRIHESGPR
jgi:hypothetical protein